MRSRQHGSIENIGQALRAEFSMDPQQNIETLRKELLNFDRAALERIVPVLSRSDKRTNQKTAQQFCGPSARKMTAAQAESLIRRIYYTSDGEKPKKHRFGRYGKTSEG